MEDFELNGIETIARGVCIMDGKVLLCKSKGGENTYLPGGHIEFGETGRAALKREVMEELGAEATVGRFMGATENTFMQNGKKHAEINLVYEFTLNEMASEAKEDWIEFVWWPVENIKNAKLLPKEFENLKGPFEP